MAAPTQRPGAWIQLALVAGVLAIYSQTLAFDFVVFDDDKYVTGNPTVLRGLSLEGLSWAFDNHAVSAWHPLTWLSHMLDAQLFGDWAGGHHATSVALHASAPQSARRGRAARRWSRGGRPPSHQRAGRRACAKTR